MLYETEANGTNRAIDPQPWYKGRGSVLLVMVME